MVVVRSAVISFGIKQLHIRTLILPLVFCGLALYCVSVISPFRPLVSSGDGLLFVFGTYMHRYLAIYPLFIFLIYDLIKPDEESRFIMEQLGKKSYMVGCFSIKLLLGAIIYPIISYLVTSLILLFSVSSAFEITEVTYNELLGVSILDVSNELNHLENLLLQLVFLQIELIAVGLFMKLLMLLTKTPVLSAFLTIIFNFVIYFIYTSSDIKWGKQFLPFEHSFLYYLNNADDIIPSLLYWAIVITISGILCFATFRKKDVFLNVQ